MKIPKFVWLHCFLATVFLFHANTAILVAQTTQGTPRRIEPTEKRIENLLSSLTIDEKISLIAGTGFDTKPGPAEIPKSL